jgi:hypothetical protein
MYDRWRPTEESQDRREEPANFAPETSEELKVQRKYVAKPTSHRDVVQRGKYRWELRKILKDIMKSVQMDDELHQMMVTRFAQAMEMAKWKAAASENPQSSYAQPMQALKDDLDDVEAS